MHLAAIEEAEGSAEQAGPDANARRATCGVCTQQLPVGVLAGVCADCAEAGLMFEGVAAIKGAFGAAHPDDVVLTIR